MIQKCKKCDENITVLVKKGRYFVPGYYCKKQDKLIGITHKTSPVWCPKRS